MMTPAQLSASLADLGIDRDLRVLTDWRQRGLLPPLEQRGLGRGKGSAYVWDADVLEQAVAAHQLLGRYARIDTTLLGLWFSGYAISPASARDAWISHLERIRNRRQQGASNYKDGFLGLAQSWSRRLRRQPSYSESIRDGFLNFMTETIEWNYDDVERDDESYQYRIVEILSGLEERKRLSPSSELYEIVETVWNRMDIPGLFRSTQLPEFVQSMSESELDKVNESLACIRQMIQHVFELQDPNRQPYGVIIGPVSLMQAMIGPLFARLMIALNRSAPELPIARSISAIHCFVMSVKLEDITRQSDGTYHVSQRVRS